MNMHAHKVIASMADAERMEQIGTARPAKTVADAFRHHAAATAIHARAEFPTAVEEAQPFEEAFGDAQTKADHALYSRIEAMPIRSKADAQAALAYLIADHASNHLVSYPTRVNSPFENADATAKLLADLAAFISTVPDVPSASVSNVSALAVDWAEKRRTFNALQDGPDDSPEERAFLQANDAIASTPSAGLSDLIAKAKVVREAALSEKMSTTDHIAHSIVVDLLRMGGERNLPEWNAA